MKCFRHNEIDAVGICRACNKGLCVDCAADLGHSIACKGSCEQAAEATHDLVSRTIVTVRSQKRIRYLFPAFIIFMGLVALFYSLTSNEPINPVTLLGVGFLVFGFAMLAYVVMWARDVKRSLRA